MATFSTVTDASSRIGVYPGSFNPPTIAHIEIAQTAREHHHLERVDLAVSQVPLGKGTVVRPSFEERLAVINASVAPIEGLGVIVTEQQLVADIATGYDVVVMGADKWAQVNDPAWYPTLALAPRAGFVVPDEHTLPVDPFLLDVSSSAVRAGRTEWMTEPARLHHDRHGTWG